MDGRGERIRRTRTVVVEHGREMTERYEAGESLADLAKAFGISGATAASTIRRNGGTIRTRNSGIRRGKQVVSERGDEMVARYAAGAKLRELAGDYGVTEGTVARAIRARGGVIRKRGHGSAPWLQRGAANHKWKGGSYVSHQGYRYVRVHPDDPYAGMARKGYVYEHRLVMARLVKRPLLPEETVHHIDGDKLNNSPENLQLRLGKHGKGQHFRCGDCGSQNVQASPL